MKVFCVAIYSNFEGTNSLYKVSSENKFEASKKALLMEAESNETRDSNFETWVSSFKDMDDLLQQCTNSDLCVSNVLEV